MDTDEMVKMAKEREGWKVWSDTPILGIRQHGMIVADYVVGEHANFIANAPRTILALVDEVARLQARCAELERNSTVLDGWCSVEESPPIAYDDDEAAKWRFEVSEEVGAVVKMNVRKHQWFFRDGRKRHIWFSNRHNIPIEPEQVIGWRPLPPPSNESSEESAFDERETHWDYQMGETP